MNSRTLLVTTALLVSGVLAGCGGGGGGAPATPSIISGITTQPIATAGPSIAAPTSTPSTSSTTSPLSNKGTIVVGVVIASSADTVVQNAYRKAQGLQASSTSTAPRVSLTPAPIVAAAASRNPLFVSPGTNGLTLVISQNGTQVSTTSDDVSSTSPLCTTSGGSRSCTIPLNVTSGTYSIAATLFNDAPVSGSIPGGAQELGTAVASSTILVGQTNSVNFFIGAVIASVGIGTATSTSAFGSLPANGSASSYAMVLIPTDGSGNAISGTSATFANTPTVTLAESGGSGHMHFVYNGSASGTSVQLQHPSDSLSVAYDGGGASGYYSTITLSASGATASTLQISPLFVTGDSKYAGGTLTYTATAQSEPFAITEASAPGTVTYGTTSGAACPSLPTGSNPQLPVPVTAVVAGSGAAATMTVTANVAPQATTGCDVKISDNLGTSFTIPVVLPAGTAAASSAVVNAQIDPTHYSTGSPATLSVTQGGISVTSLTLHQSAGPVSLTVSESNDVSAPVVTATSCSGIVTVASSLTQGTWSPTAMGALSGTVVLVATAAGSCTVQISDGNGQSVTVTLTALVPGVITEFASTLSQPANSSVYDNTNYQGTTNGMAYGSDGNIWVTEGTDLAQITPSGTLTEFSLGAGSLRGIASGSDGNLWIVNTSNNILVVSTSGTLLHTYSSGFNNNLNIQPSSPWSIVAGADGALYYSGTSDAYAGVNPGYGGGSIGRITTTGTVNTVCYQGANGVALFGSNYNGSTIFFVGSDPNNSSGIYSGSWNTSSGVGYWEDFCGGGVNDGITAAASWGPYGLVAGTSDGNIWWISRSQVAGTAPVIYGACAYSAPEFPIGMAGGPDGNLWIALSGGVERLATNCLASAVFNKTASGGSLSSFPISIIAGPGGNMWFVENNGKFGNVSP